MIKLTDQMKELINKALADGNPCVIATASKEGIPDVGFKGSMMAFDDESLAYWERTLHTTISNIEQNPNVMVLFRNPTERVAWRFLGTAMVYKEGPMRQEVMSRVVQPELDRDPNRIGIAVVIKLNKVLGAGPQVLQER
ncbi:MAG: pyridoxamine 5'-phosphate oxidase family protein [Candidatus Tectomicrobia bacterium]|nr:pyridoxamine 5'-phosphate oxidase family protein [Candidatus Tectomicrobia bacterium]